MSDEGRADDVEGRGPGCDETHRVRRPNDNVLVHERQANASSSGEQVEGSLSAAPRESAPTRSESDMAPPLPSAQLVGA